jgi:FixJ family two-component response regulator
LSHILSLGSAQKAPRSAAKETTLRPTPTISVIDDDPSVRVATDNLLRSLGYIVHTFVSADEFLQSADFKNTSCVIADVQMPGMSGLELQAFLLAREYHVPLIFITAFPEETVRARVLKAGAVGFLTKPFDRRTLIECLNAALERHDGRRE